VFSLAFEMHTKGLEGKGTSSSSLLN